jgi:hypothetical protein
MSLLVVLSISQQLSTPCELHSSVDMLRRRRQQTTVTHFLALKAVQDIISLPKIHFVYGLDARHVRTMTKCGRLDDRSNPLLLAAQSFGSCEMLCRYVAIDGVTEFRTLHNNSDRASSQQQFIFAEEHRGRFT